MPNPPETQIDLDVFFEGAQRDAPQMSTRLMENILGDAAAVSAARQAPPALPRTPARTRGWLARLLAPLGGIPGAIAVAACAVIGVGVGYGGTDTLESLPGMGTIVSAISGDPLNDLGFGNTDEITVFLSEG